MKKISLLIMACILYINASAQSPFTFGPMVGAGLTIPSTNISTSTVKMNGSFLGGAFARISIKRMYIEPEVYYSNKTANFSAPAAVSGDEDVKTQVKTGNVNVNALIGVKIIKSALFNFRAFVGPSTSLIVAKSIAQQGVNYPASNIRSSSFNVQGGLGIDVGNLVVDVRYEQSFTDLTTTPANDIKINSVLLTLGFKFL
jgi:hypothetical protein